MAKTKLMSITQGPKPPRFIIYTGDLPDHHPDNGPNHDTNIRTVLDELLEIAGPIPLFYAPGNNDPRGGDYDPYTDANCETPLDLVGANSGYPAPNAETIYSNNQALGYYSARPFEGLRIIALNTVMFSGRHESQYPSHCVHDTLNQEQEAQEQLSWLKGELAAAKSNKEKAYIIMHIPPGVDAYQGNSMWKNHAWEDSLLLYADQYSATISGVFFGHTHMDEIRRLTLPNDATKFSAVAISAPGISPIFNNNPGFKTVYYNKKYEAIDYITHYTYLVNGVWGVNNTSWGDSTYTFSESYGKGNTIEKTISKLTVSEVYDQMIKVYMVKSGNTSGSNSIQEGITVD